MVGDRGMNLELRQLRALVAVVEQGTFTDAAYSLGISQAAVSRAVAGMEVALGARLLDRTTRSIALTPLGATVLEHAARVLEELAVIERLAVADGELRLGYAWSALGVHTTAVQQRWAHDHLEAPLVFVQSSSPTAGLAEGLADVAVIRHQLDDPRFTVRQIGAEERYAALPSNDPLARRRSLVLADFAGRTIGVDRRTGTTDESLWPVGQGPGRVRVTGGVDDWLTMIAAGQVLGMTSEATAHQYPRPGVTYRPVRDAPSIMINLAWWRTHPPARLDELTELIMDAYASRSPWAAP